MNVVLFMPILSEQQVEEADAQQREAAKALTAKGDYARYAQVIVMQCEGPLQCFLMPDTHKSTSRFPLLKERSLIR